MAGRESTTSVSAIIPAYNAEAYLRDALDSVLAQTHPVTECMVVDDGSVDGTAAVAAEYAPQVRVVQQENSGVAAARNRGASEAACDLLSFLDADDSLASRSTGASARRRWTALARAEAVLCATRVVDAEGGQLGVITQPPGLARRGRADVPQRAWSLSARICSSDETRTKHSGASTSASPRRRTGHSTSG